MPDLRDPLDLAFVRRYCIGFDSPRAGVEQRERLRRRFTEEFRNRLRQLSPGLRAGAVDVLVDNNAQSIDAVVQTTMEGQDRYNQDPSTGLLLPIPPAHTFETRSNDMVGSFEFAAQYRGTWAQEYQAELQDPQELSFLSAVTEDLGRESLSNETDLQWERRITLEEIRTRRFPLIDRELLDQASRLGEEAGRRLQRFGKRPPLHWMIEAVIHAKLPPEPEVQKKKSGEEVVRFISFWERLRENPFEL